MSANECHFVTHWRVEAAWKRSAPCWKNRLTWFAGGPTFISPCAKLRNSPAVASLRYRERVHFLALFGNLL